MSSATHMEQFSYNQIAVIGAAGKMGNGISLLILQEMARNKIAKSSMTSEDFILTLIDTSQDGLKGLKKYLRAQMLKWAEKNIAFLRQSVMELEFLISNREIIDHFMTISMDIICFASSLEEAKESKLIFEAISENIDTKVRILSLLEKQSSKRPYFFSNTSSIPISLLNEQAALQGRIIGFHFYNPPAVQKLIEIIPLDNGDPELIKLAETLAQRLNKEIIYSKDIAGFIGNGYFLREINFACALAEELSKKYGTLQSIYIVNKVTQEFMLRPMGIFQLIDYVGLDVVSNIGNIMHQYLHLPISYTNIFQKLTVNGIYGGQQSNGSQKNGFFQYTGNEISGIYSSEYISINELEGKASIDEMIGTPPDNLSWKSLSKATNREILIQNYFEKLSHEKSFGAELAMKLLHNLHKIINDLVEDGVAKSVEDVKNVLKKGFYQLLG
ncbi:MAG: 3-hydroxyacyl-CoA dehydrogenase family protein [Parachlamydiaceae bacterium]|nr:3-hydroxyacyl-CoA dehydrogenase family protein [Parachlamydiaceae bacterium]